MYIDNLAAFTEERYIQHTKRQHPAIRFQHNTSLLTSNQVTTEIPVSRHLLDLQKDKRVLDKNKQSVISVNNQGLLIS